MDLFKLKRDRNALIDRHSIIQNIYNIERKDSIDKLQVVKNYIKSSNHFYDTCDEAEANYDKTLLEIKQEEEEKRKIKPIEISPYYVSPAIDNRIHENNLKKLSKIKDNIKIKDVKLDPTIFSNFK